MSQFAGIFFQMRAPNANHTGTCGSVHDQIAIYCQWIFILRNLVPFGQVRVKIILTGKNGGGLNLAAQSERHANAKFYCALVENRQGARHPGTNRADTGIRRSQGGIHYLAAAKHFAAGCQFGMHFQTDHGFILHAG